MPRKNSTEPIATIGIDIGKNTFHLIGLDKKGAMSKFTEAQIFSILKRTHDGTTVAEVCRKVGIFDASFIPGARSTLA